MASASFGTSGEGALYQSYFTQFKNYNVNNNHPLIPNSQEYIFYNKYVSIHSEDRNVEKYPNSSEFEIELPEDINNVATIKLVQWTFPANYNVFSVANRNVSLTFTISNPCNPGALGVLSLYNEQIFEALYYNKSTPITFIIEDGFYNPQQMSIELTNKFNFATTTLIAKYFNEKGYIDSLNILTQTGGYNRFIIVYHTVGQKLWFGNNADGFTINNLIGTVVNEFDPVSNCFPPGAGSKGGIPDSSTYGLPGYLGLPRCNITSTNTPGLSDIGQNSVYQGTVVPRFYYGDVTPGDNGFWLLPNVDLSGCSVNWIEAIYKINLMGEAFIYMEIEGQNCIDETQPFNVSSFNRETNLTNGIVNSAFAKMAVPTTPISQWFDRDSVPYKLYYPPAERIRRLKIRLRYHDGRAVNFGVFNFSFMLQFTCLDPQILRATKAIVFPPPIGR
jgi:hypothetical protein